MVFVGVQRLAAVGALILALASPALASDKRVALVIGNSAYRNAKALSTPVNDATELAAKLEKLGFTVSLATDLDAKAAAIVRVPRGASRC
jgi:hypothetical protein